MRLLAALLNIGLLGLVLIVLADVGSPDDTKEILLITFMVGVPVVNLIALRIDGADMGVLKAYLERKKLENQVKSRQLREDLNQD
jgi:hypothetical protein